MAARHGENFIPWYSRGKALNVRSKKELIDIILQSDDVKEAIALVARERAKQYEGHL